MEIDRSTLCNLTRGDIRNIPLPQTLCNLSFINAVIVEDEFTATDPFHLKEIPSENDVSIAKETLIAAKKTSEYHGDIAVRIPNLGTFTESGIHDIEKLRQMLRIKSSVIQEERWLKGDSQDITLNDQEAILDILHNRKPQETIIKHNGLSIDTHSLSTIACERYVDNFVIDVCLQKYCEGKHKYLCLPTHAFQWVKHDHNSFLKKKVIDWVGECSTSEVQIVFAPVHLNGCHWGLIVVDLTRKRCYFDDGMKWFLSMDIMEDFKTMMNALKDAFAQADNLRDGFWSNLSTFERFGMPLQPKHGDGIGSCGIGVVLAARDIIRRGCIPESFLWRYEDMRYQRKKLILKIIEWVKKGGNS